MDLILEFIKNLTDSEFIVKSGYIVILFVIFAESGLFFGFFLPGDYLVFLSGLFCANGQIDINIYLFVVLMILSGTLGNIIGYIFGYKIGYSMYQWKDNWFFKKLYLKKAEEFYKKRGKLALIIGKYFPIIRTFAPIIAGIIRLEFKKFLYLNVIGNILWIGVLCLLGYYLGNLVPEIVDYIHYIILFFIVVTVVPLGIVVIRSSLNHKKSN